MDPENIDNFFWMFVLMLLAVNDINVETLCDNNAEKEKG